MPYEMADFVNTQTGWRVWRAAATWTAQAVIGSRVSGCDRKGL
jgi:hypothetical protein